MAAASLAVHAGINAADAVTGMRLGQRAAGQNHDEVLALLYQAGPTEGPSSERSFVCFLRRPMWSTTRTSAEGDSPQGRRWAQRCVAVARRVAAGQDPS